MAGLVSVDDVAARIATARHQDSVRALGLLPLASGENGAHDLLNRYKSLQAFRRESRKFGSQRQQSEKRAVEIGLANLARTAGYHDPQRLAWAMEREALGDLMQGPVVRQQGDVTLTLSLDDTGTANLSASRKGKPLAAIPPGLRKDPEVVDLKQRMQELRGQRSRVKAALEEAMCRGDHFSPAEIGELLRHPVLAPAIGRLLFTGSGVEGHAVEEGRALADHTGAHQPLDDATALRLAHPYDLFCSGTWSLWQRTCFHATWVQPFKQIFRELYPMTEMERGLSLSRRYAGHQVNPRQALSLFGGRGWIAHPEHGVHRTFHHEGVTARLTFQEAFYTPADVEGLTIEAVAFTKKGEWDALPLQDIPPRVFSETMRDLDLVVSVAHRGGVDPERRRLPWRCAPPSSVRRARRWPRQRRGDSQSRDYRRKAWPLLRALGERWCQRAARQRPLDCRGPLTASRTALPAVRRRRSEDRRSAVEGTAALERWRDQRPEHPRADPDGNNRPQVTSMNER